MLAIKLRVRPCKARCFGWSEGRETTICSSSTAICMSSGSRWDSSPFPPLTCSILSSSFTSTPAGIGIGCLPIRDTTATSLRPLPYVADDFAAYSLLSCLAVAHDALGRRHHRHAQPAEDARNLIPSCIHPSAGLADSFQSRNDPLAIRAVLQIQTHDALLAVFN